MSEQASAYGVQPASEPEVVQPKCAHCHRPPHAWQHVLAPSAARFVVFKPYRGPRRRGMRGVR